MSILNGYATVAQFAERYLADIGSSSLTAQTTQIEQLIESACRKIDKETQTQFYASTASTARIFQAEYPCKCRIDDLKTLVSVAVDMDFDGTYETTLTSGTDFVLNPANDLPYTELEILPWAVNIGSWPVGNPRGVKVTGTWGNDQTWATNLVREAALLQAWRWYKRSAAPFGIVGGGELGTATALPGLDPDIVAMLQPVTRRVWWG